MLRRSACHLFVCLLQIGPEGAIALAAALKVNPVLSYLNLSGTSIGEGAVECIPVQNVPPVRSTVGPKSYDGPP